MSLPFGPPLAPMLAVLADGLPEGDFLYEPKWDGFRVLVFRDGDTIELRSRDDKPLLRYFPELEPALRRALPEVAVADGEIVIARDGALHFDQLQLRLHPAASRIRRLSTELPAQVVLWDLLADGAEDLRGRPFAERRARLEARIAPDPSVLVTPATRDPAVARDWFARFQGAGLDGVMAKPLDGPYQPGKRVMVKVKHTRTLDAVVAGFRWHKGGVETEVGSLVLGLFDDSGELHPIGVAASFTRAERRRLLDVLGPLRDPAEHPWARWEGGEHRPDQHSRWSAEKDLSWESVRLGRVVEVTTTQHDGRRLRHPAKVLRWRTDKPPADCTLDQLRIVPAPELAALGRG